MPLETAPFLLPKLRSGAAGSLALAVGRSWHSFQGQAKPVAPPSVLWNVCSPVRSLRGHPARREAAQRTSEIPGPLEQRAKPAGSPALRTHGVTGDEKPFQATCYTTENEDKDTSFYDFY